MRAAHFSPFIRRSALRLRQRLALCGMIIFLLFSVAPAQVLADNPCFPDTATSETNNPSASGGLGACQKQLYSEGVNVYDAATGTAQQCGSDTGASGGATNNAEYIWNFFGGNGLTPVAIAGIMGNFNQEDGNYFVKADSAFDPARKQSNTTRAIPDNGDGKTGYGIAQWTYQDRQAGLFAKMREAGLQQYYGAGWGHPEKDMDPTNAEGMRKLLAVELSYAWEGDTTKIKDIADQLNATTTVTGDNGSTVLFHQLFERSRDKASGIQERVNDAVRFLQQFGDTGTNSCAGELGGVSGIADAIAWADRFYSETQQTYHPGGNKLDGPRSTAITELYHIVDNGKTCWGGAADCSQCTALSGWFVTQMTDYPYGGGNGEAVVGNMKAKGVPTGDEPRPFSIFSYDTGTFGHTGLVLGTLGNGEVITLENNWPTGILSVRQYNIKAEYPHATFAYVGDKLKVPGIDTSQSGGTQ
jgi:surface antigen